MLYGISPFVKDGRGPRTSGRHDFETRIIALKDVASGERVGYGGAWTASGASRIAVAAVGYGDGYPRAARNSTPFRERVSQTVAGRPRWT